MLPIPPTDPDGSTVAAMGHSTDSHSNRGYESCYVSRCCRQDLAKVGWRNGTDWSWLRTGIAAQPAVGIIQVRSRRIALCIDHGHDGAHPITVVVSMDAPGAAGAILSGGTSQ